MLSINWFDILGVGAAIYFHCISVPVLGNCCVEVTANASTLDVGLALIIDGHVLFSDTISGTQLCASDERMYLLLITNFVLSQIYCLLFLFLLTLWFRVAWFAWGHSCAASVPPHHNGYQRGINNNIYVYVLSFLTGVINFWNLNWVCWCCEYFLFCLCFC